MFVTNGILPLPPGAASSKRVLDGALNTAAQARRAAHGASARRSLGSPFWAAGALMLRRGAAPRGILGVVGPGEPTSARAHSGSAPRETTLPKVLTKECLWGGRAPPNGMRLSCGADSRRRPAERE